MNEPTTVTYPIAEVLTRIENKLEKLNTIEVQVATLTEKVNGIDKRLEKVETEQAVMVKAISDLQGFRSLILPIIVGGISAVIGGIVTAIARFVFYPIT